MKRVLFSICSVTILLILLWGCDKNDIIPEDKPGTEITTDTLPADNDPVSGLIAGEIAEADYNELKSTTLVTINRIPYSLGKFLELRELIAHTPQGAAAMMIVAMRIYQQYPELGMKCLTANSTTPLISASTASDSYNGERMSNTNELKRKLSDYSYLPMVYFKGASPKNGYTPDGPPYMVELSVNQYSYTPASDGSLRVKLFVATQGADSPRPVTVRKIGNLYYVTEYSSLYLAPKNLSN
jgi:hypothetical protein